MSELKIGILDIETLPASVYVFDLWNQNISLAQVIEPVRVGGFGWKWVDEEEGRFYGEGSMTHREVIEEAFALMSEADAIVTYNGDKFDIPHLNREFLEYDLGRPEPFASIDLYKVVKKHHKFLSKKLAHLLDRLELSRKIANDGWPLWIACLNGNPAAWEEMETYCLGDVTGTGELYDELLAWIDNHPNVQLYGALVDDGYRCPRCKSDRVIKQGFKRTRVGKFQQYQCQDCGSWSHSGKRIEGVDVR